MNNKLALLVEFLKIVLAVGANAAVIYYYSEFGYVTLSLTFIILINSLIEGARGLPKMLRMVFMIFCFVGMCMAAVRAEQIFADMVFGNTLFVYAYWLFIGVAGVVAFNYLYASLEYYLVIGALLSVFLYRFAILIGFASYAGTAGVYGYLTFLALIIIRYVVRKKAVAISAMVVFLLANLLFASLIDNFLENDRYYFYAGCLYFPAAVFYYIFMLEKRTRRKCKTCVGWGKLLDKERAKRKDKDEEVSEEDYTTIVCPTCQGKGWAHRKKVFQD